MKTTTIFFSGTNTTKTIITKIAYEISSEVVPINLTNRSLETDVEFTSEQLVLVGMPVYGGRIPSIARDSLKHLKGTQTPVILVAVYGNREFEDALVEMQDLMGNNGFKVIAAGAFIAQHSIFPQTAKGRPDAADFDCIKDFSRQCKTLIQKGISIHATPIHIPGNRPYKIPGNIPLKIMTSKQCTSCGICAKLCPVNAIPTDKPYNTNHEQCIHCGRCMNACPEHARHYGGLLFHLAGTLFMWKNSKRKEPQFFF